MEDFGAVLGSKIDTKWVQEFMIFLFDFWTAPGAQKEAPTFLSGPIQVHGEGIKGRVNPPL